MVAAVQFKSGTVQFILEDGTALSPANISSLNTIDSHPTLTEASRLIGRKVTWMNEGQEVTAAVSSVFLKDGLVSIEVIDEKESILSINQLIKVS